MEREKETLEEMRSEEEKKRCEEEYCLLGYNAV
jgi:hypothetical protein